MARRNGTNDRYPNLSPGAMRVQGLQFLEADGPTAGTWTKDVMLPAYALLDDIVIHNEALWTAGTSALLDVGLYTTASPPVAIDADYWYSAVDLKATELLATQSISFAFAGGDNGAGLATATHILNRVDVVDRWIRFLVTTVGTVGTAGITFAYVSYAVPELDLVAFTDTP